MRRNKPGLSDLKTLRQQAQPQDPPPPPRLPQRAARKRSPFLPPSPAAAEPAADRSAAPPPTPAHPRTDAAPHRPDPAPALSALSAAAEAAARLSESDRKLFRYAVRHVDKMKDPNRVLLAPTAVAHAAILEERRLRAAGLEAPKAAKQRAREPEADGKPPAPVRKASSLSDNYAPATHDQNDSQYLKAGHGSDILRDLKRGKWPIGASLDLHGSTLEDARERFERFLSSCLTHNVKCVQIVHGKGYGSPNGDAVLKTTVRRWLTQIAEVIAYVECTEADGGSGAVQVLLK